MISKRRQPAPQEILSSHRMKNMRAQHRNILPSGSRLRCCASCRSAFLTTSSLRYGCILPHDHIFMVDLATYLIVFAHVCEDNYHNAICVLICGVNHCFVFDILRNQSQAQYAAKKTE